MDDSPDSGPNRVHAVVLVGCFIGLAGLELVHAVGRFESLRTQSRAQFLRAVERVHGGLVHDLGNRFDIGRRQASYLSHLPPVAEMLGRRPGEHHDCEEVAELLHSYLDSFPEIERVRLLDPEGMESYLFGRDEAGSYHHRDHGLSPEPDEGVLAVVERLGPDEVGATGLTIDPDGFVLVDYACGVSRDGVPVGSLVLTVHAEKILRTVREFAPIEGVSILLIDGDGRPLASDRASESGEIVGPFLQRFPRASEELPHGRQRIAEDGVRFFSEHIAPDSRLCLLAAIPDEALLRKASPLGRELFWIVGTTVGSVLALAFATLYVHRLGRKALELSEARHSLALAERESARMRELIESMPDLLFVCDLEGRVREANSAARGRVPEPERVPMEQRFREEDAGAFREAFEAAAASPGSPCSVARLHLAAESSQDAPVVDGRLVAIELEGETAMIVSLRDVTHTVELEDRLHTAERLSSLGLLTAGVAHEVNNPLEGITNYLALLRREDLPPAKRERFVDEVRHGLQRIRDIVRDLLAFARPTGSEEGVSAREAVDRAVQLARLSRELDGVGLEVDPTDDLGELATHARGLEQVLLNLLLNAGRAAGSRGKVTVSAERVLVSGKPWIRLVVEDDGPGIPEEELSRVFDPFFSKSGGTGLGLSVSYGLVRAHGGEIVAANRPEGGARFTVRLPALPGQPRRNAA